MQFGFLARINAHVGRSGRILGLAVIAIMLITAPAPVEAKKRRLSPQKQAQKEKRRAFKLFRKGKYEEGIEAMESAYRLVPHPGFLLNIAVAFDQWGDHCKDSLVAFDRFFEVCGGDCKMLRAAKKRHGQVQAACLGEVAVFTHPAGAAVEVDGSFAGEAPVTAPLPPGKHVVVARLGGHEARTESFEITPGATTKLNLALEPEAAAPPPPPPPPPPPDSVITTPRPPPDDSINPWPYVSFGVGAAGLGVGVIYTFATFAALDAEEAARIERNTKAEVQRLQRDATSKAVIANVGYGIAAVGLTAGVLMLILDDDEDDESEPVVSWGVGPNGIGIAGTF